MTDVSTIDQSLGPLKFAGEVKTHSFALAAPQFDRLANRALLRDTSAGATPEAKAPEFKRADIVVDGVDHSGPSFEVRVFGNNPGATATTEPTAENGYLGSFHVFGHGFCFGDAGHCEVNNRGAAKTDLRDPHPLAPEQKIVVATDGIKSLIARDGALAQVSLVPIAIGSAPTDTDPKARDVLKYNNIRVITYD